ncbi:glutamyl-tRNA reductase [Bacillaceae bacterium S4-13-58]
MQIVVVGLNYRTAPVEIREKLTFQENELKDAMVALNQQKSILENVIVSTCNRTELYAVVDQLHTGRYYIKQFLSQWFNLSMESFIPYLTIYEEEAAIEHLFRVTSGLDSMVVGETQILGQVKQSFMQAQEVSTTGTIFNQLFKQAVTLAKKSHKETGIGAHAVSVSYAAVELAKKVFGDLGNKQVVILGAGKMGELAAKNLYGSGIQTLSVVNRTKSKAEELAKRISGMAYALDELKTLLPSTDILISSTGANGYVLKKEHLQEIHRLRKGKPMILVDIAVPRDIDPSVGELDGIFLYDIDDLQGIVDSNMEQRKQVADTIGLMIEEEIVLFKEWLQTLGVVPVISALRIKALSIQEDTMKSIDRKMPDLTDRERKVLNKHTKSIVNQLLKDPILQVKELSAQKNAEETLDLFVKIFNIEDEVKKEVQKQNAKGTGAYPLKSNGKASVQVVKQASS